MSTRIGTMTADELLLLPDDNMRHELVRGEHRVMPPAGADHGDVALTVGALLNAYVRRENLGRAFAAETGFVIGHDPDTVRAPDAAFVSKDRYELLGRTERFWPEAPKFAAEVVSPDDSSREVEEKAFDWLDAGTKVVLVVDPDRRTATVFRGRGDVRVYERDANVDLSDAVPGWRPSLGELFD